MNIKKHIPNALTCCNLLCGCIATVQIFEGSLVYAAYLVGLAAVFDFFDGFAARLLRVTSPIGKDLDSLADMVTFGVVPGLMMFQLLRNSFMKSILGNVNINSENISTLPYHINGELEFAGLLNFIPFIIIVFSAIRLAKFNNDTRQTTSFIGLPTPANAILICSFPLILGYNNYNIINDIIHNPVFLISSSIILSILLISEIPLFALKFRSFSWSGNKTRYIFLALCVVLLCLFQFVGIPLIILLYILMSMNSNYFAKRKDRN